MSIQNRWYIFRIMHINLNIYITWGKIQMEEDSNLWRVVFDKILQTITMFSCIRIVVFTLMFQK